MGLSGKKFLDTKCREWIGPEYDPPRHHEGSNATTTEGNTCDKWIVLTTINPPTEAVKQFETLGEKIQSVEDGPWETDCPDSSG